MRKINKELFWLILLTLIFIGVRSINYVYHLNWSGDQASYGIEALRIFRTKTLTLIGPQISANFQGRFIFQGPLIYYFFLLFLLLGGWDPVISSYLFMVFASLMILPLYYGVKKLINVKAAWIAVIIYTFTPYYLNYTRFLWNSTLLFSLLLLMILFMGWYKETKKWLFFFFLSIWSGVLLQFHYQFIVIIFGLFFYYFLLKKLKFTQMIVFVLGVVLGFSPLIIFELKHNFYNLNTLILFIKNWSQVDRPGSITTPHYYITISFMMLIVFLGLFAKKIKKISNFYLLIFTLIIGLYAFWLNLPKPPHAFWAPTSPWNYLSEKRIYEIIRSTDIKSDFNIANLAYYDTPAIVIKYFLKRDGYQIDYSDYYRNKYLFVVSEGDKYLVNPAYEIATFKPRKIINQWKINERFDLYLLERKPST